MIIRLLMLAAAIYVAITLLFFFMQRKMLYLPETYRPGVQAMEKMGLTPWPSEGAALRGWLAEPEGSVRGTVVVFHGNAGGAWQRDYYSRALTRRGFRVLLAEYPGYSGRSGSPSQQALVQDAYATIQAVRERLEGPVILWGESLGAGVVAGAVARAPQMADGLVLLTPWERLADVAARHYPWLPVQVFLLDRYDNVANLAAYEGKVAVLVAEDDGIVPAIHGETLFEHLGQPKRLWRFADAGHNSVPIQPGEVWWDEVLDFVTGSAGKRLPER